MSNPYALNYLGDGTTLSPEVVNIFKHANVVQKNDGAGYEICIARYEPGPWNSHPGYHYVMQGYSPDCDSGDRQILRDGPGSLPRLYQDICAGKVVAKSVSGQVLDNVWMYKEGWPEVSILMVLLRSFDGTNLEHFTKYLTSNPERCLWEATQKSIDRHWARVRQKMVN
jgi:hypothetical protein